MANKTTFKRFIIAFLALGALYAPLKAATADHNFIQKIRGLDDKLVRIKSVRQNGQKLRKDFQSFQSSWTGNLLKSTDLFLGRNVKNLSENPQLQPFFMAGLVVLLVIYCVFGLKIVYLRMSKFLKRENKSDLKSNFETNLEPKVEPNKRGHATTIMKYKQILRVIERKTNAMRILQIELQALEERRKKVAFQLAKKEIPIPISGN